LPSILARRCQVEFAELNTTSQSTDKTSGYRIVRLACGAHSIHSLAHAETFHPVVGPVAEAQALYVDQLKLIERVRHHQGEFVIWDVGLGAAANALTALRALRDLSCPISLVSFDHTLEPLAFALDNLQHLPYLADYQVQLRELLGQRPIRFSDRNTSVQWQIVLADFPSFVQTAPARELSKPHLVMFDAFSPAKNPAMWTLPLFSNLFGLLDSCRPCCLPTYSRSTILRVTLLLAGFFVGVGHATGEKEETTIAANSLELIQEPLGRRWLERVKRSSSAEPLLEPVYLQRQLSPAHWERLLAHPQFRP
jgi:tRNA U34 5-methylaminomethyl-2-thiouridine-forming methyltransferase MnmC